MTVDELFAPYPESRRIFGALAAATVGVVEPARMDDELIEAWRTAR